MQGDENLICLLKRLSLASLANLQSRYQAKAHVLQPPTSPWSEKQQTSKNEAKHKLKSISNTRVILSMSMRILQTCKHTEAKLKKKMQPSTAH